MSDLPFRISSRGLGFVQNETVFPVTIKAASIITPAEVSVISVHTGTRLGGVHIQDRYPISVKWIENQEDIAKKITIISCDEQGKKINEKSEFIAFLTKEADDWLVLTLAEDDLYEWQVIGVIRHDNYIPNIIPQQSLFKIHQIRPNKSKEYRYGDIYAFQNIKSGKFLAKGEKGGCTLDDDENISMYPYFFDSNRNDFMGGFSSFTVGPGIPFCITAECTNIGNETDKYFRYKGCGMLYWQIADINGEIVSQDTLDTIEKAESKSHGKNVQSEALWFLFLPLFFLFIVLIVILILKLK